jgi:hypothetical protein
MEWFYPFHLILVLYSSDRHKLLHPHSHGTALSMSRRMMARDLKDSRKNKKKDKQDQDEENKDGSELGNKTLWEVTSHEKNVNITAGIRNSNKIFSVGIFERGKSLE